MDNNALYRAAQEIASLPTRENRLRRLEEQLAKRRETTAALLADWQREERDVQAMEKNGFSAFFWRIAGKYEDRMDKEARKAMEAKAEYDRALAEEEMLAAEVDREKKRLGEIRRIEADYREELTRRRRLLQENAALPQAGEFRALQQEHEQRAGQVTEVEEALRECSLAQGAAQAARKSLESARSWATYDIWGGKGVISHAAKYAHIDDAEAGFNRLNAQLSVLRRELADIHELPDAGLMAISGGQRVVDYWFDNIFTDVSVRNQIDGNLSTLDDMLGKLKCLSSDLSGRKKELERRAAAIWAKQEALLLAMGGTAKEGDNP